MAHEKPDRRVRNTRQRLRNALLELLREKRYEAISVEEIIARADVARSTFYTHYIDKDDLLTGAHGIFAENLDRQIAAHARQHQTASFTGLPWFHHIQAQGDILKIIARDPAMSLTLHTLRAIIRRSVEKDLQAHTQEADRSGIPFSVTVDYVTDSLISLIKWWVDHGMKETPTEMDEMFKRLVLPGFASVLKVERESNGEN